MIALQSDCLLFQLANGESVPCSAEMISVEIAGNAEGLLDPEMLRHAAASVFHYFKNELERETRHRRRIRRRAGKSPAPARLYHPRRRAGTAARGKLSKPTLACSRANPPTAWNFFSSRACATNCAPSSASRRAFCAFADCAAASSNSPARDAGASVAKNCRITSSNTSAAA